MRSETEQNLIHYYEAQNTKYKIALSLATEDCEKSKSFYLVEAEKIMNEEVRN